VAERTQRTASHLPIFVGTLLLAGIAGFVLFRAQRLPTGPEAVAWDRAVCAHCHMHVGDPHYAAQLQTSDGDVLNFDDPGCLFLYVQSRHPTVHATYYHDAHTERWWRRDEAGFVPAAHTPMGYGLAATSRGTAGAVSADEAARRVVGGAQARPSP